MHAQMNSSVYSNSCINFLLLGEVHVSLFCFSVFFGSRKSECLNSTLIKNCTIDSVEGFINPPSERALLCGNILKYTHHLHFYDVLICFNLMCFGWIMWQAKIYS